MKHFISLVLAGVMTAVFVTFSSPTVTAETENHDNVLIAYFSKNQLLHRSPLRGCCTNIPMLCRYQARKKGAYH